MSPFFMHEVKTDLCPRYIWQKYLSLPRNDLRNADFDIFHIFAQHTIENILKDILDAFLEQIIDREKLSITV